MSSHLVLIVAVASSAVTTLYHHIAGSTAEARARRASCSHTWGPTTEVCPPGRYSTHRQRFYKRFCERGCGEQLDVDERGNPYVPRRLRDK